MPDFGERHANYLAVLEATAVAHVVRPYSQGGSTEIVAAPRVFGFDTGFVCYYRGWGRAALRRRGRAARVNRPKGLAAWRADLLKP